MIICAWVADYLIAVPFFYKLQIMESFSAKLRSKSLDFDCDDSKFLFKNRRFVSVDRGLSTASSSLYSGDSDYPSTDWGSFSEEEDDDDDIEVLDNGVSGIIV